MPRRRPRRHHRPFEGSRNRSRQSRDSGAGSARTSAGKGARRVLDRIEVRCSQDDGGDVRVVAEIGRANVKCQVSLDGKRTTRTAPRERVAAIVMRLEKAAVSPVAFQPSGGRAAGYEVTLTAGMTQSVFRWVAATPAGWEPIAQAADDLIALAGSLDADG